jgi:hypothetical protein
MAARREASGPAEKTRQTSNGMGAKRGDNQHSNSQEINQIAAAVGTASNSTAENASKTILGLAQ